MRSARALAFTVGALILAWAGSVLGTPSTISFQGKLASSGGSPVADGNYAVTFTLWTDSVGGSLIWTELQSVHVTGGEGLFTCPLGSLQPLGGALVLHANDDLYIQMALSGEVLSPRLAVGAVPQAFSSSSVHHVEPGVGSMEMEVGDDTTKITASHQGFSTLIDSYVHLIDDRALLGLKLYDPTLTYLIGDAVVIDHNIAQRSLDYDDDADGIANVSVWEKVDNTGSISGTAVDLDDDGDPDVGSTSSAKVAATVLKSFFQTGDFPTQSQFMDSADATGAHQSTVSSGPDASSSSNMRVRINDLETKLQSIGLLARSSVTNSLTPTTCGVAINTKGTGAAKGRTISSTCDDSSAVLFLEVDDDGDGNAESRGIVTTKPGSGSAGGTSASTRMTADSDDDGVPESEASMIVTPTTSSVAINTKGTGADKGRSIGSTCDDSGAIQVIEVDEDGDGHAESRGIIASKPQSSPTSMIAFSRMTCDTDDDGLPENEVVCGVTPTTSSVAINTKGTGADKNRTIGSTCDDSSAIQVIEVDDDGDGIAEAKAAVSSVSSLGGGGGGGAASSAYARMTTDTDDDGDPENDATMIVTPTTSSVAINTKGTGADKNRVVGQTTDQDAVMSVGNDAKNIGLYVNAVTGQSSITMTDQTMGTVDTGIVIDGALKRFGIGVGQPANPIEHSSGAKLTSGGVWTNASDANSKENFQAIDGEEILEKLDGLEITRWNYKAEKGSEHIGPTAQDFKKTFGVGSDGKSISTIDPSGIALAAIKELNRQNKSLLETSSDLAAQNRTLLEQNALLKKQFEELARKVESLAATR